MILLGFMLLGLSACKIEFNHEIWLNKDNSGHAKVDFILNMPQYLEADAEDPMAKDNALADLADKLRDIPGIKITDMKMATNHDEEELNYHYSMEFTFDSLKALQMALFNDPDKGITIQKVKGKKQIVIDTRQLYLQDEGEMDEYSEYLDMFNMNLSVKLNLPKKPRNMSDDPEYTVSKKSIKWDMVLDSDYYAKDTNLLVVEY
jgi:hypothetical protein